jgi:5'(3')-deoxyribonucleotidase
MSIDMIDYIVGEHHIDIDPHMLRRVKVISYVQRAFTMLMELFSDLLGFANRNSWVVQVLEI